VLAQYRKRLTNDHGWEVSLRCGRCGADAVPNFHGWTASQAINFGNKPTIYANLECPKCGEDMKEAAGEKLVALFAEEATPAKFKQMVLQFIVVQKPLLPGFQRNICFSRIKSQRASPRCVSDANNSRQAVSVAIR
jgi:hypothetical protein